MADIIWQIINFKRKAIRSLKNRGIADSFRLGRKALVSIFWLDKEVFKFHLNVKDVYQLPTPLPGVKVREVREEDFPELLKFSMHFNEKEMLDRFAHNHKCFIVRMDNKIIFYGWIGINQAYVPLLGKQVTISADRPYFYNTFTDEHYRDKKILPSFASKTKEFCIQQGFPFGFTLVDAEIGMPIKAYSQIIGAEKVFLIRYRRRFGIKTYLTKEISLKDAARISNRYRNREKAFNAVPSPNQA